MMWLVRRQREINLQIRTAGGECAGRDAGQERQPGQLLESNVSPLAWIMNQMLYDKFHGHGWVLDLLAGSFVKQKENKQCH